MKTKTEYDKFENLTRKLVNVTHSELKAKLDAEKMAKMAKKRKKTKVYSASREAV
jgi:hypothetical protein